MATKNNEAIKAANILKAENDAAADKERELAEQANRDALLVKAREQHEKDRAAVIRQANLFGVQSARGEMSLTKLAFLFNDAVRRRFMTVADAEVTYKAYVDARNAAVAAGTMSCRATQSASDAMPAKSTTWPLSRTFCAPEVEASALAYQ